MEDENKKLSVKVLKKIKNEKIKPKSRWEFLFKDYFIWFLGILFLIIGAFVFAVIFYIFDDNDWALHKHLGYSSVGFFFDTLPYVWIAIFVIFVIAARYNFRHTKKGYKYNVPLIVVGVVLFSALLGFVLHNIGMGQIIDEKLLEKEFYGKFVNKKKIIWSCPEKGVLSGKIISVEEDGNFKLVDFDKNEWMVVGGDAIVNPRTDIEKYTMVKVVGEVLKENHFKAKIIAPWMRDKASPWLKEKFRMKPPGEKMMSPKGFPGRMKE